MINDFNLEFIIAAVEKASLEKNYNYFCTSRDIFQARLDTYISNTNKYFESAIIGEIGNNTFDHNWDYEKGQARGAYFNADNAQLIILADFGQGLRNSLSSVRKINSDLEAVKIAFTERLSGRSPEQLGNGLKFVCNSVKEKLWSLYFQSGNACCIIERGQIFFLEQKHSIVGCLAVLEF